MNTHKSYNSSIKKLIYSFLFITFSINISLSADCDGNPVSKKFKESDCDKRDIDVLREIIELNNLTKISKNLFGNEKVVLLEPFDIGIQTWSYGRLIAINLENLNLSKLPESIGVLTTLEKLELSNNNLTSLPDGFGGLKPLKYLHISNNKLTSLPNSIYNLDRLREFDLSNNKLKFLPENFGQLKSLKVLDLNTNNLIALPSSFRKFRNLVKLDISNNNISKLEKQISDLARLKEISARNNKIISIPNNIGNLRNIERINFSGNKIEKIPNSIGNCYTLISLNFSNNILESIPKEIGQLNLLETLKLNKNNISIIPNELNNLNKLIFLNLSHNKISDLSSNIKALYSLEYLDLSHNSFTKIPKTISGYINLIKLNLSYNKINEQNILIGNLKNLKELLIQNNPIKELNIEIQNSKNLKDINISNIGIIQINEQICEYTNAKINLNHNKLCDKQPYCIEQRIDRKNQYCTEPIVEYIDVIKEIIVEKIVEIEVQKEQENDIYPNFKNSKKQKLFRSSLIQIVELDKPDTLFALFESPYEYSYIRPNSNNFTYSISNSISQNGRRLNEFSFLELVGGIDLLNNFKIQLYENLKSYSENPYEYAQVHAWTDEKSIEYKFGITLSWIALTSWVNGINLKLNKNYRNLPFFLSAVVLKVIQNNLFNKLVTKSTIKKPPHINQFLSHKQLIALADKYNKEIFEEIKSIN